MPNMESLISELKINKLRLTALRRSLLEVMLKSERPLSMSELQSSLARRRVKAHKTSVYRQLEALEKHKLIQTVQLGENKKRYELYAQEHHHHLVCIDCGRVEDVEAKNDLNRLESKIAREKKFKVTRHSLEFFGFCAQCSEA